MTTYTVHNQAELDAAIAKATPSDYIDVVGSATVTAYGSATVWAYGSATVTAYGSATVWAYGSATVWAYGSATVWAYGSATVRASRHVVVRHWARDTRVTITGGIVITTPEVDTAEAWCEYHGVTVTDGVATLYKAVGDDWTTPYSARVGIAYVPGTTVTAVDWRRTKSCGNGLHACAWPVAALAYNREATRFVSVTVPLSKIVVIDETKVKAQRLTVVAEVDIDGNPKAGA